MSSYGLVGASRFSYTRGRISGSAQRGLTYPTPFFDIGHTYLPTTIKDLFRWCRYYFLVNPLINAMVFKLAQYAITALVYHTEDKDKKELWQTFFEEVLNYRSFQLETGLDHFTYGNALISIFFPFKKMLRCSNCKFTNAANQANYYFRSFDFYWQCPRCGHHGTALVHDQYIRSSRGIRLLRWNPEDVSIQYNDLNGEYRYYYEIPLGVKNDIIMGKKHIIEEVPQIFIESLKKRKSIVFSRDNVYHFRRPTLAGKDRGWGIPLLLPLLKEGFFRQIMLKAQEAILIDHIVPLRVMFPQSASGTADVYSTVNLGQWKDQIAEEIQRWRSDRNYIPILPLPIGNQTIGGDGRSLLLGQELRVNAEQIAVGAGFPPELLFGGMNYSGSNVSLRMMENTFLGYITDQVLMLNWIVRNVSSYMDWEPVNIKFKPFKMADDLQRKAFNLQLSQLNKLSDDTLLSDSDFDAQREDDQIKRETNRRADAQRKTQLSQAEIQGESQMIMMRYQLKAQQEQQQMQMAGQPAPGEPGAEAEGIQPGGQAQPGAEAQQPQQPPPLPQQPMPPQAMQQPPPQAMPAMPPAVGEMQSPLNTAQQVQGEGMVNVDLLAAAQQVAAQLLNLDENSRTVALMSLRQQSPEFYQTVLGLMQNMQSGQGNGAGGQPLPEQRPPTRGAESALV